MKFLNISQTQINTIILFSIGIALFLATFAYFRKTNTHEGFEGEENWKLSSNNNGNFVIKHKDAATGLEITPEGTVINNTINTIDQNLKTLEETVQAIPAGESGAKGTTGEQGIPGMIGPEGPKGEIGSEGQQGPIGPPGMIGPAGPTGSEGSPGIMGPPGMMGPAGEKGEQGPKGADGDGQSIVNAEVNASGHLILLYDDNTTQDFGKVVGPAGPVGEQGSQGPEGPQGPQGPTGPVTPGDRGDPGPKGDPGDSGPGVSSAEIVNNELILHLTSGTSINAGTVGGGGGGGGDMTNYVKFSDLTEIMQKLVPPGTIIAFSGSEIPEGWVICNGQNGTPDLTGRFIMGSTIAGAGESGGGLPWKMTIAQVAKHQHNACYRGGSRDGWSGVQYSGWGHGCNATLPDTAPWAPGGEEIPNSTFTPPYYKLAYIMKVAYPTAGLSGWPRPGACTEQNDSLNFGATIEDEATGNLVQKFVDNVNSSMTEEKCREFCQANPDCKFFSKKTDNTKCLLFPSCPADDMITSGWYNQMESFPVGGGGSGAEDTAPDSWKKYNDKLCDGGDGGEVSYGYENGAHLSVGHSLDGCKNECIESSGSSAHPGCKFISWRENDGLCTLHYAYRASECPRWTNNGSKTYCRNPSGC